jgi:hypothetical protein
MTNSITVQVKHVYGTPTAYPLCQAAKVFAQIAKTKTLTAADLHRIKALGFSIIQQTEPAFNL